MIHMLNKTESNQSHAITYLSCMRNMHLWLSRKSLNFKTMNEKIMNNEISYKKSGSRVLECT